MGVLNFTLFLYTIESIDHNKRRRCNLKEGEEEGETRSETRLNPCTMAVETDAVVASPVVVECKEEEGGLNFNNSSSSHQQDPTKDCLDVVVHDNENEKEIHGGGDRETKDDADPDAAYVFVNDADIVSSPHSDTGLDTIHDPPPTTDAAAADHTSNAGDSNAAQLDVHLEDEGKGTDFQCPSNAAVQEQNNELHSSAAVVQENQESVLVASSDSELQPLHNNNQDETLVVVEEEEEEKLKPDVEQNSESHVIVTETVQSKSQGEEETAKPADQIQESQPANNGDLKLELHQIDTDQEDKVVEQSKSDSDTTKVIEDQETQILAADESQVHQLVVGDDKEAEKEEEEPSGSQRDLNLETTVSPVVDESNLDQEARQVGKDQDTQILNLESELVQADDKETEIEALEEQTSGHVATHMDLNSESPISPEDDSLLEKEAKDVGQDQDTQMLGTESVESELHHVINGDDKERQKEIPVEEPSGDNSTQRDLSLETDVCPIDDDSQFNKEAKDVEEDQDTHLLGVESVESGSHQLVNGCNKETENEAPVEEPSGHIGAQMDLNEETAICLADDSQLDKEAANDTKESVPVQCTSVEPEVISDSAEGQENICVSHIDAAESEPDNVNGSVENNKGLSSIADISKSEKDVGDIPIEGEDSLPTGPADCEAIESAVANGSGEYESFPTCSVEGSKATAEIGQVAPNCSLDETSAVTEVGNGSKERGESMSTCFVDNVTSEAEIDNKSTDSNLSISTLLVADAGIESEAINAPVERGSNVPACSNDEAEQESEAGNSSPSSNMDIPSGENGSAVDTASMPNCANDVIDAEHVGDRSKDSDGKSICAEDEGIEGTERNGVQPFSSVDSTNDAMEGQKTNEEVVKRPFRFLIRIPRYVDDKIREEIRLAQLQVDERTQSRDAIRAAIQAERANCSEFRIKFDAARSDERAARDALNAKRQELDSVQSVITRIKNATSIDEIDDRIHNMEHMIQHETMPLKEEKQLIREIKQLKNLRDQLSSSLGKQAEEQPTLEERDRIEERFKLLKRESASTRTEVLQFEGITKAARKIYFDKNEKIRELQSQFRAADDLRQEAYTHLQNLKKQLYEKNKYFRMYKDDMKKAEDLAFAGDKEELQRLCVGQVETMMELWNNNDDFRNEYIRCNTMSTLRRLRTLDGRSLGPDEEPPVLRNFLDEKVDNTLAASPKIASILPVTTSEQGRSTEPQGPVKVEVKPLVNLEQKNPKASVKSVVNVEKDPAAKSKKVSKPTALETGSVTISGREEVDVEDKKRREEEELARKAEELRKEEAAAKLKEQRRLEEKAKAKEAEERKKRNAEKAQAKAELRAKKEAELKEKEREKRARKKERKVAAAALTEGTNDGIEGESTPSLENTQPETTTTNGQEQPETKDKAGVVTKRKAQKQTKVKALPLPPPLRNRGRRRMQPWMWVLLAALIIVALFLVGNSGYSFKFSLPSSFGFF